MQIEISVETYQLQGSRWEQARRERDDLCNKRRFGSGKVSCIAERIALILASLLSISCQVKEYRTTSTGRINISINKT